MGRFGLERIGLERKGMKWIRFETIEQEKLVLKGLNWIRKDGI